MMKVIQSIEEWRALRKSGLFIGKTTGFVPTMGALHDGHLSLVRKSLEENDFTVVSIFVNPTQFNDPKDLKNYPRSFEADSKLLQDAGVSFVLNPEFDDLYRDCNRYQIHETGLSQELCGAMRPGHFSGVLTVVLRLMNLVRADRLYLGEKDYQQYLLIRGMAEAFFFDTEIISVPTVRASDGLALSSRNALLEKKQREQAPYFSLGLRSARAPQAVKADLEKLGFQVDYIEDRCGRRFGAVRLGNVRLIDNVQL